MPRTVVCPRRAVAPGSSHLMKTWYDCTGFDNTSFVVAGAPEGRERVAMVGAKIAPGADEADRKAVRHILDSFEADCETQRKRTKSGQSGRRSGRGPTGLRPFCC